MKKFRRLGSETVISVDVRVLSATNVAPELAISEGKLREDLYYRLAQFPIHVPPLRQRGDDIAGLARIFPECIERAAINTSITITSLRRSPSNRESILAWQCARTETLYRASLHHVRRGN